PAGRAPEVVVDGDDVAEAVGAGEIRQRVLTSSAFEIVLHLDDSRLANIDQGSPLQNVFGEVSASHRIPRDPRAARPRSPAASRPGRQRRAGDPVKHPGWNDRAGAVWHLANSHELAATMFGIVDAYAAPDKRVPGIVNLAGVTDAGRMNGSSCNGEDHVRHA